MKTKPFVLAFGELLWDVLPSEKVLGGAPANFSVRLNSIGTPVLLVSRVGNDALGEAALKELHMRGLNTSLVQRDTLHPTGTVDVVVDARGNPAFTINPQVAYDYIEPQEALIEKAREAAIICYGSLVQRAETTRETLYHILSISRQATKIVDINLRRNCYTPETIKASLEFADILKLNEDEAYEIARLFLVEGSDIVAIARGIVARFNLQSCLVTRGEKGICAVSSAGQVVEQPAYRVRVVDTIGSGDAFTAGFVSRLLKGATFEECCEFGNRLGGMVAATKGGMTPISLSDMERFGRKAERSNWSGIATGAAPGDRSSC